MMFVLLFVLTQFDTQHVEAKCCYAAQQYQRYERAESLHSFNVLTYELALTLPMTNRSLSGINNIACKSRIDGLNALTLHSYTLTIDSVKVDGVSATFGASDDTLHIDLPQTYNTDDSFNISVAYHGSWSVTGSQLGFLYYPKNYNVNTLHAIAYTMSEPWDARRWMPCYDEPYDKADYGSVISVTVPDTFMVCANGELINETSNPDMTKTFTYQENYPITTYLMHFAVSRWTDWSDWHYEASGDSIELTYFVWPEDSAMADTAFQCIPIAMALYDSMYGSYPFDRYGQDAVYPFAWGGMEHQELTTIHRFWIHGNEEGGMAHELAHMWWGDMVTCVDFRDIWLNEGFATYSDGNYRWHRWGYDAFLNIMTSRRTSYFSADNYSRRPLYNPPTNDIFNYGYTYCKASWVVHMLRYLDVFDTGNDTTFFNAVAAYRDSFAYGTASTDDLNVVCSAVYGTNLTWFFDEWVYGQGHPQYRIYWVCNPSVSNYVTKIEISQIQTNAPPVFHIPVQILLHRQSTDTLITIEVDAAYEYVEIEVLDSVTSIDFDPNLWLIEKHRIFLLDSVPPVAPYVANVEKSDAHAQLTWTKISTDSLGGPESMDYYVIYRDTVPDFVPGESLAYVNHPETTYTDSNALNATQSYYYLVKAVDAKKQTSSRSNMAYVFHKSLNENIDAADKNWTSFPWSSTYATVSDVVADVSPAGEPLTTITHLRDDQHYESRFRDDLFEGRTETVYVSHGTQWSECDTQLHYAFNVLSDPSTHQMRMVYSLEKQMPVTIFIYDVNGRQVRLFDLGAQTPGHYTLLWNRSDERGRKVPAGVYFVRFEAQAFAAQEKMLLQ